MGIGVTRVSKDETRVEFCREILSEFLGSEWALVARDSDYGDSKEYVWDFMAGDTVIPREMESSNRGRQWFVIRRKDLHALQTPVESAELSELLKPVPRGVFARFLDSPSLHGIGQTDDYGGLADDLRIERDEMLQFLVQANLKLQENDQERINFLARSLHDFRAPLTAISGYCGLLLEQEFGPLTPEQQSVLGRMLHSATRLSRISNGMFQLSAPRNVDQKLNLEQADIRDCLDHALHEVALILEDKRISIAAEIEPVPGALLFEKSQMEQTLVNLLDNACKFTPRDGAIEIRGYPYFWERRTRHSAPGRTVDRRVSHDKVFNSFRLDMRDSGPGIPAIHLDRIFDEFTSCGGGQDRSGGGLGLAICRMILHRHQGRIWAESDPSGTVFSFVLPLSKMAARLSKGEDSSLIACPTETVEN